VIDDRIAKAWSLHPHRFEIPATPDFFAKVTRAVAIVADLLPPCCRAPSFEGWTDRDDLLAALPTPLAMLWHDLAERVPVTAPLPRARVTCRTGYSR